MPINKEKIKYIPGTYAVKRPDAIQITNQYMRQWEQKHRKTIEKEVRSAELPPVICFSRKIGSGALEVADILAQKLKCRVADREILDQMARDTKLGQETVAFFDERYPGKRVELVTMLFGEKSFIMSDYMRNFISAVFTLAEMGPLILVGRGAHMILPRDRVLAVRFICSNEHRIKRLSTILNIDAKEAEKTLQEIDREQHEFFRKAYGIKDASPYEFDLVINSEHIASPQGAANIVACAFEEKFGLAQCG